jgi:uncharacterized protein (TIGR02145 family)
MMTKKYNSIILFFTSYLFFVIISGCKKESTNVIVIPVLKTVDITNITKTTAESGGQISSAGGAEITIHGVCWSTTQNPTITNTKTNDGSGIGNYSSTISNLEPNSTYYIRAYATNSVGTAYGNEICFTTSKPNVSIVTIDISNITQKSASSGGIISSDDETLITARGVCWNTSQSPTIDNYKTTDGIGNGSYLSSLSNLSLNTTYYVRAYVTNSYGTYYGSEKSFKTIQFITNTDIDGYTYDTVRLGNQTWMAENLRVTRYNDGNNIPNPVTVNSWSKNTVGGYCEVNNTSSNSVTYGLLYNWFAVNTGKLCPIGWHIPSDNEWTLLEKYLISANYSFGGSNSIGKALASSTSWAISTTYGSVGYDTTKNNKSGFSALAAGTRSVKGDFLNFKYFAAWWSTTDWNDGTSSVKYLGNDGSAVVSTTKYKNEGMSIRCLKD